MHSIVLKSLSVSLIPLSLSDDDPCIPQLDSSARSVPHPLKLPFPKSCVTLPPPPLPHPPVVAFTFVLLIRHDFDIVTLPLFQPQEVLRCRRAAVRVIIAWLLWVGAQVVVSELSRSG